MTAHADGPLSATEFHVLMVLAEAPGYGYGIMKAVAKQSQGLVTPEIGSLYRVLARLVESGWAEEVAAPTDAQTGSRGQPRRYYALTATGRAVAHAEARRLAHLVRLARDHEMLPETGSR